MPAFVVHFSAEILVIGLGQSDGQRQHILLWGVQYRDCR